MLSFLIARDTMHQQQWLAVVEELGGNDEQLPIPNSFPQSDENQRFSYAFVDPRVGDAEPLTGRFAQGRSLDGRGEFAVVPPMAKSHSSCHPQPAAAPSASK